MEVAGKTLDKGDRLVAKDLVVLAFRQEDPIQALDRILPSMPEPTFELEEEDQLSEGQVAKILAIASDLEKLKKQKIVSQILAKVERIEARKRRKKEQTK